MLLSIAIVGRITLWEQEHFLFFALVVKSLAGSGF